MGLEWGMKSFLVFGLFLRIRDESKLSIRWNGAFKSFICIWCFLTLRMV